jgi:hypothetical protein
MIQQVSFKYCTKPPSSTSTYENATVFSEMAVVSITDVSDAGNVLAALSPDNRIGIARHSFTKVHGVLLGEQHDIGRLLSEQQLVQYGLHFPFSLVK